MYDAHSAQLLHSTDWRRLGALWNPGPHVRQWGAPPNEAELAALGRARLAASVQVNAADIFWQHHPHDQRALILCAARVSSVEPGWEIVLLDEEQRPFWHLKADRLAELHCVDHCGGWQPGCRGVVSVPSGGRREPPAPPPMVGMGEPSPSPRPAPVQSSWRDRRRDRVARQMGWSAPAAAAEPQQASVPDGWRWPSSAPASSHPVTADRGEIHAQHYEQAYSSAWPAQQYLPDYASRPTPSVEQAAPPRRGWIAGLFGGAAAVPAVVETAPSVPPTWDWPEPAGEEYRGQLHEPPPLAIEQQEWQWPNAVSGSTIESPHAIEHQPAFWDVAALSAPDAGSMGWDSQEAVTAQPEPLQVPSGPDGQRWQSSVPATSYPSEADETPERRSFFGALFGRRREEPAPAIEHPAASGAPPEAPRPEWEQPYAPWGAPVPFEMKWPETYPTGVSLPVLAVPQPGEAYRGSLYSPEPDPPAEIEAGEPRRSLFAGWLGRRGEPSDTLPAPDNHFAALEPPALADSYALEQGFASPETYAPGAVDWGGGEQERLSTPNEVSQFLDDVRNAPLPPLQFDDGANEEPVQSLPAPDGTADKN